MENKYQWRRSREVVERIVIQGTLVLETPAHFGNGDAESYTDMPLFRDPATGKALLTGASLAGALRNYLRECELGYNVAEEKNGRTHAELLFGHLDEPKEQTVHSWLMIDDSCCKDEVQVELRDGVGIDPQTRTAAKKMKYDIELLPAGTEFELSFELWRPENEAEHKMLYDALLYCLHGLQERHIHLGQRKRRGLGQCTMKDWKIWRFDMKTAQGLGGWLEFDPKNVAPHETVLPAVPVFKDRREQVTLRASFQLDSSLMIRSGDSLVDMAHLKSKRDGIAQPILPGTGITGALRARALRIANTVLSSKPRVAKDLVEGMFGKAMRRMEDDKKSTAENDDQPTGSRVLVKETVVKNAINNLVQSRVKIDRFTGGVYPGALFSQQPLFGKKDTEIEINLTLRKPNDPSKNKNFDAEVGLLLLVLKDLWTVDLPLGGESSVGRGRLIGKRATLKILDKEYILTQMNGKLMISNSQGRKEEELKAELENYVRKLQEVA